MRKFVFFNFFYIYKLTTIQSFTGKQIMMMASTQIPNDQILETPWKTGENCKARLRLATDKEKSDRAKEESGFWWYCNSTWRFVCSYYNVIRLYRNLNIIDNMAPWVDPGGKYHFEYPLRGRVSHCFYHPTTMQAILKYPRNDPRNPLGPLLEEGDMSKKVTVDLLNEIFPGSKISSEDFILSASAEQNWRFRNALHQFFSGPKIKQLRKEIQNIATKRTELWRAEQELFGEVNINRAVHFFTSEVITKLFIGKESSGPRTFKAVYTFSRRIIEKSLKKPPSDPDAWKEAKILLSNLVNDVIKTPPSDGSFVHYLLSQGFTENEVRATIFTLYIGGFETTATSLTNTLLFLAQNPDQQKLIFEEFDDFDEILNYKPDKDLPHLHQLIRNSLREFTPAYAIGRQPKDDLIMEIKENNGSLIKYYIHKDDKIFVSPLFAAQKYGEEVSLDKPEPLVWYPFGSGKHSCPGKDLAWTEMILFIRELLLRYELTTAFEGKPTQVGLFLNSIKETITVELSERNTKI